MMMEMPTTKKKEELKPKLSPDALRAIEQLPGEPIYRVVTTSSKAGERFSATVNIPDLRGQVELAVAAGEGDFTLAPGVTDVPETLAASDVGHRLAMDKQIQAIGKLFPGLTDSQLLDFVYHRIFRDSTAQDPRYKEGFMIEPVRQRPDGKLIAIPHTEQEFMANREMALRIAAKAGQMNITEEEILEKVKKEQGLRSEDAISDRFVSVPVYATDSDADAALGA